MYKRKRQQITNFIIVESFSLAWLGEEITFISYSFSTVGIRSTWSPSGENVRFLSMNPGFEFHYSRFLEPVIVLIFFLGYRLLRIQNLKKPSEVPWI